VRGKKLSYKKMWINMKNIKHKQGQSPFEVIIIGAGPAGIACAVMLKHLGINPLLIEKHKIGGLLRNGWLVKNYLGLNELSGKDIVKKMAGHLKDFKIKPVYEEAVQISAGKYFTVKTNKKVYKSKFLVLASGTKAKKLKLNFPQNKIFYEIADFVPQENKITAVIGAGDAAFDYALSLSEKNKVIILNRGTKIKANGFLREKVRGNKNISYVRNCKIDKILSAKGRKICDYAAIAIGRESSYPEISKTALKHKNLFLIGDIKNGRYRQASISAADGIKTAMEIAKFSRYCSF
jgi:thioredoxin reductase